MSSKVRKASVLMSIPLLTTTFLATPINIRAAINDNATNVTKPTTAIPEGIVKVTSVEGITEYQLKNGLKVLLFPDASKPTITVNITYMVGSRHENYGETGMAHLLEHLVFKGTPKHPDIPKELTEHGTRPNGTTSFDRTNYFETFQATDENLNWALDLESDRMINSYIAKKDLDSEMTVVRNEFESGENSPQRVLIERLLSTAFLWHNYGNTTIGARSDIENVPIERLQAFYRNYYQPDNAVLTVAGKFDEEKTLQLIDKYFSSIPKPTRQLIRTYTAEPTQDGERLVTLRRTGDVQLVGCLYHTAPGSHPDFAAVDVLTQIVGDFNTGRLRKALVETKKASAAYGFSFQQREPGMMLFGAEVRQDSSLDEAKDIMIKTIENIANEPPTQEEVERAKTALLKEFELTLNDPNRVGLTLSEFQAMGDWRLFFLHRDRIKKVTVDDVKKVAASYIKSSNRTVGLFIPTAKPERAEVPDVPDIAAMLKDYKGAEAIAAGEAFDPSPNNIELRLTRQNISNIKLAMLPKKTRGNSVQVAMTFHLGDEKSLNNRVTAGDLAGQMLMRGTKKRTRQQIQDEFDKLKARTFVAGSSSQAVVGIETTRENLPAVVDLVAEILREPAFDANEFEQLRQEQLAEIEQQRSEPTSVGGTEFQRIMSNYPKGDVRYVSTPDEDIAEVKAAKLEDVKKFYDDFYGASKAEITVVGSFDDKQFAQQITEKLGNWTSKTQPQRITRPYQAATVTNKALETPDKANAFFIAGMNLNIRDDDPDYAGLVLGNYMLGGGFLNSRLATRIRQKEGLSYGVGSQLNASSFDKNGSFVTFAIYAPENVVKLEAAFKEEIEKMLKDGFTEAEITAAKSGYLQSRQVSRAQDNELARRLNAFLFSDRKLDFDKELELRISALTNDQILQAMRKHIDPSKIVIIKAGDFAKKPAK
ncbi:MAG: pitrilysin family protein [Blastocatellia bacterium]